MPHKVGLCLWDVFVRRLHQHVETLSPSAKVRLVAGAVHAGGGGAACKLARGAVLHVEHVSAELEGKLYAAVSGVEALHVEHDVDPHAGQLEHVGVGLVDPFGKVKVDFVSFVWWFAF